MSNTARAAYLSRDIVLFGTARTMYFQFVDKKIVNGCVMVVDSFVDGLIIKQKTFIRFFKTHDPGCGINSVINTFSCFLLSSFLSR